MRVGRGDLNIVLCQCDILWEAPRENCRRLSRLVESYMEGRTADILVFPEFFSMGFTMNYDAVLLEGGQTLRWMQSIALKYNLAVVGSVPTASDGRIVNRCYFIAPDGAELHYDKRHLFRMGEENEHYAAGESKVIAHYKGWNIALNVCYDLRFPVWSRNIGLEYDLLLNVASWPDSRIGVTEYLIKARAIENMSYAAFCNRIGEDPANAYNGHSRVISPRGEDIAAAEDMGVAQFLSATLSAAKLDFLREKFPAWKDADLFEIKNEK